MPSRTQKLAQKGLIQPPKWLPESVQYETIMGSVAYGVSSDTSDMDVYGFAIPPKHMVFPHLAGEISGFGRQIQRFEQFQAHHIKSPEERKEYDVSVYNIVKYFHLCMENNPNMIDSLFTPHRCVLYITPVGDLVRSNRRTFLHKGAWHKFKGYAYSQMKAIRSGRNKKNEKRQADIDRFGYDTKFAYHVVRLMCEVEQIMIEHDLDLERNREQLKEIRAGQWTLEQLDDWFAVKEKALEDVYARSTLRYGPDEEEIKAILLQCFEQHYGSLDNAVRVVPDAEKLVAELRTVLDKYA